MIVKVKASSVSIIFLEIALEWELSITSFIHMSVAEVIWKHKMPSWLNS